jgi:hypothetical protein
MTASSAVMSLRLRIICTTLALLQRGSLKQKHYEHISLLVHPAQDPSPPSI